MKRPLWRDRLLSAAFLLLCSLAAGFLLPFACAILNRLGAYMLPGLWQIPDISFYRDAGVPLMLRQAGLAALSNAILLFFLFRFMRLFFYRTRSAFIFARGGEVTLRDALRDYFRRYGLADAEGLAFLLVLSLAAFFLTERRSRLYDLFTCPCTLYEGFGAPLGALLFVLTCAAVWGGAVVYSLAAWRCKCFSAMGQGAERC